MQLLLSSCGCLLHMAEALLQGVLFQPQPLCLLLRAGQLLPQVLGMLQGTHAGGLGVYEQGSLKHRLQAGLGQLGCMLQVNCAQRSRCVPHLQGLPTPLQAWLAGPR